MKSSCLETVKDITYYIKRIPPELCTFFLGMFATLLSGLVDGHTHAVWAGDRVHEFAMKVRFTIFNINN